MPENLQGWKIRTSDTGWKVLAPKTVEGKKSEPMATPPSSLPLRGGAVGFGGGGNPHPSTVVPSDNLQGSFTQSSINDDLPSSPGRGGEVSPYTEPEPIIKPSTSKTIRTLFIPQTKSTPSSGRSSGTDPQLQLPEDAEKNSVLVNLTTKRAQVIAPNGKIIKDYPVYTGMASNPTPEGRFKILDNLTGNDVFVTGDKVPDYYANHFLPFKQELIPGESQDTMNILGFHGWKYNKTTKEMQEAEPNWTPEMWSQKTKTHGCIQLDNDDIKEFSALVTSGSPVRIISK